METILLEAQARDMKQTAAGLRRLGKIPAIVYGRGIKNREIAMEYQTFRKVFLKAGENTIIELAMDGKKMPVLVHEVQYNPVSDSIAHVDFVHVDMDREVTAVVKLTFVGVSPAVKTMGGILDVKKHELKIKCLPKDLIHSIEVDISGIVDFRTSVHVKDVKIPAGIKVLDQLDDTVVTATPQRVEKEEAPAVAIPTEGVAAPATGAAATPVAGVAAAPAKEQGKK